MDELSSQDNYTKRPKISRMQPAKLFSEVTSINWFWKRMGGTGQNLQNDANVRISGRLSAAADPHVMLPKLPYTCN
jgi:hypothetical protein